MNAKKFSDAMSELDSKYVDEAINYKKKAQKSVWVKWGVMAACLCLIVVGGLGISWVLFNGNIGTQSTCGHTNHDITILEDDVYFTCQNVGVFIYHRKGGECEKITDEYGKLTKTSSGLLLFNDETGVVYQISGSSVTALCNIEAKSTVIGIIDDNLYYLSSDEKSVMTANLITGDNKEVLSIGNGHIIRLIINDNILYYSYYENDTASIKVCDTTTNEQGELYHISANNTNEPISIYFTEEYIFIGTEKGLFHMPYANTTPIFLTEYSPSSGAFDYYNGKVYFTVEADSKANLISIDVETGEINEVVSLVESNKTVRTYTEIAVCADGFYYTNPSNTDGGLFYHAFNQTEEIKICTD